MRGMSRPLLISQVMQGKQASYQDIVLATSPSAYWPLNETSGSMAINYGSIASADGTYDGVTLANAAAPGGGMAPSFDGTNDYVDVYSAALNAGWNGNEGSLMFWFKVYAAAAWTGGATYSIMKIRSGNNNELLFIKTSNNNQVRFNVDIGADLDTEDVALSSDDWVQVVITWSKVAGEKKYYINGALAATDALGAVSWSGALAANACLFGSYLTDNLVDSFKGWMAQIAIWTTPLNLTTIQTLYNQGL